ncbi:hypothetical protein PQG02_06845 [Nostoc sp. UHCC 0926]|uniref:hypothetical protein n=1 Tax=unclassified Nostoc TaxID=2593658 RepID=UPI00235E5CBE|nr:hypothetical protein [Nostoc sp. UHCC 0926]WDD34058.1 hypothetical protein PQG02_06845 [Nostoc sp. UHCC 0926]
MINEPDYSDPAYWESQGIKMIVIDPEDKESVDAGFEEVTQRIKEAVSKIQKTDTADF